MKTYKPFQKIEIYISGEDLQRLDNYFFALPECEVKDGIRLLSEQRAVVAGSLVCGVLTLIEEVKTCKG